jgi:hypothetical protein
VQEPLQHCPLQTVDKMPPQQLLLASTGPKQQTPPAAQLAPGQHWSPQSGVAQQTLPPVDVAWHDSPAPQQAPPQAWLAGQHVPATGSTQTSPGLQATLRLPQHVEPAT